MRHSQVSRTVLAVLGALLVSSAVQALANRVFVSARSGNDANTCDNILAPCQTFAGAVTKLNPGGEAIVLDSGGYGPVTITMPLTIEAPPGVLAFIHPPSGDAVTINAGTSDTVVLRGLVLNAGSGNGIKANTVGALFVEIVAISGFANFGIWMAGGGKLEVKNTDVQGCGVGVEIGNNSGMVTATIDHCHLDGNGTGFRITSHNPGGSTTAVTNSTANNNSSNGWSFFITNAFAALFLESCSGSGNAMNGVFAQSNGSGGNDGVFYSNCAFSGNGSYGVDQEVSASVQSRGNNTMAGNLMGQTHGTILTFPGN